MLSTFTNNGAGGETLEFHHPDRLGTKLITNNQANTSFEQSTLPFGTALDAETSGTTNQRFTSYDRSNVAQLDYAVNRSYSAGTGRFTSVDPIGMSAASLGDPQSLNMYAYVGNDPINFTDSLGLNEDEEIIDGGTTYAPYWDWGFFFRSWFGGGGVSIEHSGGGGGGGVDPGAAEPAKQENPNCITNSVSNSKVGTKRVIMAGGAFNTPYGPPYGTDLNRNAHDGIHLNAPVGTINVNALPAMAGKVLHYGFQNDGKQGDTSVLDIQLNAKAGNEPLVLTLKDMVYKQGQYKNGSPIRANQILGQVNGGGYDNPGESGLHVTLYTLSTYNKYIKGRYNNKARTSVPYAKLMNAATDDRSPFKCP